MKKTRTGGYARLTVICTHNSRRSHMGQLWLRAAATYYGVGGVAVFSGGTEATAFNPRAVAALKRAGFKLHRAGGGENPRYEASYGKTFPSVIMFSKRFDHSDNPKEGFAAVMVCSDADATCPVAPGAEGRFSVPFEDPKNFDGTPYEQSAYDERCRQIAREMLFAVRHAKQWILEDLEKSNALHPKN